MSDQSTRASTPNPDPRQPFTLSREDAVALHAAADPTARSEEETQAALNSWWLEAGQRLGFVWTTVGDLTWQAGSDQAHVANPAGITGATFTAWPIEPVLLPDPDAVAWLADMVTKGDPNTLKNRELILLAWSAGRDTGFAMGSATAQANEAVLGWDGMVLIREAAELFREYARHHEAKVEAIVAEEVAAADTDAYCERLNEAAGKVYRNQDMAGKLETFLADPTQSKHTHDLLREVMEDNRTAALAGWHAAMLQVRTLIESGDWWRASTSTPSGIPPLVLLDRLGELPPPDDMDEVFQRLRDPMAQVERLRTAMREWFDKSDWVGHAIRDRIPQKLGMPNQLGRHTMDTARDMVERLNTLLAEALAGTLIGLRVQATADVLQAMGIADPGAAGQAVRPGGAVRSRSSTAVDLSGQNTVLAPEPTVGGLFPGDPGYQPISFFTREPIAEGLECVAVERPPFVAWCQTGFADGDIVEVRDKNGHELPMKVGSLQFTNALRELGKRMPVRAATAEQRQGWEA